MLHADIAALKVVLISTYDLGRQPFGLASPAAWLRADGHHVTTADLSREPPPLEAVREADWICFHLPMHTATRLAVPQIRAARLLNPVAHVVCYGLYAPANEELLRSLGVETVIGGEFERALADLVGGRAGKHELIVLDRLPFLTPDRAALPPLDRYAQVMRDGVKTVTGYTEASRGCKHLCRHCPIVPVYEGRFRVVQREVVLADIRQQNAAGARHITFGDPDFLNGPAHARAIVQALHSEFPDVTWDATIKVEHLLKHRDLVPEFRRTGCLFVTSAVESLDDAVLARLAKGHTRADFYEALGLMRENGLALIPTFIPFTPWTSMDAYRDLLRAIRDLDLVPNLAPIQLAVRLLIPAGSKILEMEDLRHGDFDAAALSWKWAHPDPAMDRLAADVQKLIRAEEKRGESRGSIFGAVWQRVFDELPDFHLPDRSTIPYLTEPWFC